MCVCTYTTYAGHARICQHLAFTHQQLTQCHEGQGQPVLPSTAPQCIMVLVVYLKKPGLQHKTKITLDQIVRVPCGLGVIQVLLSRKEDLKSLLLNQTGLNIYVRSKCCCRYTCSAYYCRCSALVLAFH